MVRSLLKSSHLTTRLSLGRLLPVSIASNEDLDKLLPDCRNLAGDFVLQQSCLGKELG